MPLLYVTQPGALVRHAQGRLLVENGGRVVLCALAREVEGAVVFGPVQVTTAALDAIWARQGHVAYVSSHGRLRGRASGAGLLLPMRRWQQFERARDAGFCLDFARTSVSGKIKNSRATLLRLARNGHGHTLRAIAADLARSARSAHHATGLDELRGVEGAAARRYFAGLREVVPSSVGFGARLRRPAPDAFNALLNLAYTLAGNELWSALEACGLDASIGFFHGAKSGRPTLALDLLEEFRAPLCDRLALGLLNTRALQERQFTFEKGARLQPLALKTFLAAYERAVNAPFCDARTGETTSFRRLFAAQARRIARSIEGGEDYQSFRHK